MHIQILLTASLLTLTFTLSCGGNVEDFRPEQIVALERAALDRWGKGDPQGFLELSAEEVTYFDPFQERRVDGLGALKALYAPIKGKVQIERYDMIDPKVQRHGDVAVLTYNLVDTGTQPGGTGKVTVRWNSTEVYARMDGKWKIVHSHWSFIKPELKTTNQ
jgi:ketosteroid isomerase-like protein